jgi:hypothetical protein
VFLQGSDEIENVGLDRFEIHRVSLAHFGGDLRGVESFFEQVENSGADDIQAKHSAEANIEQNSAVLGFRSPHCIGYLEHCLNASEGMVGPLQSRSLWQLRGANSTNKAFCSQAEGLGPQEDGRAEHSGTSRDGLISILFAFMT